MPETVQFVLFKISERLAYIALEHAQRAGVAAVRQGVADAVLRQVGDAVLIFFVGIVQKMLIEFLRFAPDYQNAPKFRLLREERGGQHLQEAADRTADGAVGVQQDLIVLLSQLAAFRTSRKWRTSPDSRRDSIRN